jgi:hypothetical protein
MGHDEHPPLRRPWDVPPCSARATCCVDGRMPAAPEAGDAVIVADTPVRHALQMMDGHTHTLPARGPLDLDLMDAMRQV